MGWSITYSVMFLLTGVGVFLVGIVKFSNILQSGGTERVRGVFQKMGNNRFVGFGVGAAATTVIQSSTATTVIIVSLVNAGVMTLGQSTAVIFGANVGTSVSNMLLSLSAFRIKYFFMALVFFGASIKIFTTKKRLNKIADVLIAFGVIFVGLELMNLAFRDGFLGGEYLRDGFESMLTAASFPLLLILIAFVLTAVIQSSTAATAIFIAMAGAGLLDFISIIYLVFGMRLGTTVTALIAAIPASRCAKRAAIMHLLFNLLGTLIFLPIVWPLQHHIAPFFENLVSDPIWQITVFGLALNLATAAILLAFIKPTNKLVYLIIPRREGVPCHEPITEEEIHEETFQGFSDTF